MLPFEGISGHLASLEKDTLLEVVTSAGLFAKFTPWELIVEASSRAGESRTAGVLPAILENMETALQQLRLLLESNLEWVPPGPRRGRPPSKPAPTVELGDALSAATSLPAGNWRLKSRSRGAALLPENDFFGPELLRDEEHAQLDDKPGKPMLDFAKASTERVRPSPKRAQAPSQKRHCCSKCRGSSFATLKGLRRHERFCASLEEADKPNARGLFPCHKCGKEFSSRRWAARHEPKCDGALTRTPQWRRLPVSGDFACAVEGCTSNQTFSGMYGLRAHFFSEHVEESERPFSCQYCQRTFAYRTNLNEHVRARHVKPHQCEQCGRRFGERDKLRNHQLTHTGEKPFSCTQCDYRTAKKYNLDVHRRNKHAVAEAEGSAQSCCDVCGRAFRSAVALKGHLTLAHSASPRGEKAASKLKPSRKKERKGRKKEAPAPLGAKDSLVDSGGPAVFSDDNPQLAAKGEPLDSDVSAMASRYLLELDDPASPSSQASLMQNAEEALLQMQQQQQQAVPAPGGDVLSQMFSGPPQDQQQFLPSTTATTVAGATDFIAGMPSQALPSGPNLPPFIHPLQQPQQPPPQVPRSIEEPPNDNQQ